ncbi:MAG: hypothetical protein Q7J16_07140 [Candidatus Cloacimonadales bacterium]|nr:hypothetical protein [Candidatus Cloacimonadales bacterium]
MKKYYFGIVMIAVILLQGCNMIQLESLWRDREITIDGNDKDWIDAQYYLKDYNVVLGVMNDENFLYLCFYPTTQELTRQLITRGCTLWINTEGKKKKEVGIHFPLGMQNPQMFEKLDKSEQQMPNDKKMELPNIEKMLLTLPKELEIIGPVRNDVVKMKLSELTGLEMAVGAHKGLFAYELKIPLYADSGNSFSLNVKPNAEFLIGFETPKIEQPKIHSKPKIPEDRISGGEIGERPDDEMGQMPGGMEQPEFTERPRSLNAWMKVFLVSK